MVSRTRRESLAPALVLGTGMVLAVLSGFLIGSGHWLAFAALFLALPLVGLLWLRFTLWVVAIPLVALFVPVALPTGTESTVPAVLLLVLGLSGAWIITGLLEWRTYLPRSPLVAPLIVFIVTNCAALLWSIGFRDPLLIDQGNLLVVQLGGLAAIILSAAAALLIAAFVREPRHLWWLALPFIPAGLFFLAVRLPGTVFTVVPVVSVRPLFPMWFAAIVYALVLVHPGIKLLWRLLLAVVLVVHLYVVCVQGVSWLSEWIPVLVAIGAITLFHSRRLFVVLLLLGGVIVATQWEFFYVNVVEYSEHEGDFERLDLWRNNWQLIEEHPVLGTGPAGYRVYYLTRHPADVRSTHNNYLDIVAQTGLVGTLGWIWLVVAGLREGRAVLRAAPPGTLRTLGVVASGGLVGALGSMALGDWVTPFAYNQTIAGYRYTVYSWVFLGVLMAIRQQVAPRANPVDVSPHERRRQARIP